MLEKLGGVPVEGKCVTCCSWGENMSSVDSFKYNFVLLYNFSCTSKDFWPVVVVFSKENLDRLIIL